LLFSVTAGSLKGGIAKLAQGGSVHAAARHAERGLIPSQRGPTVPTSMYEDGRYAANNPRWHQDDSAWKAGHLAGLLDDDVLAAMRACKPMRVAEIGCGAAGVVAHLGALLAARGVSCALTGYDIAAHALDLAALHHPEVRLLRGDFRSDQEPYDLGLIVDFLEHVEHPEEFLAPAARRFRWLLCHIPLDRHWWGRLTMGRGYEAFLERDRGHLHTYTTRMALDLVTAHGLRIRAWKHTPWGLEWPGRGPKEAVLRVARRIGMSVAPSATVRVLGGASLAVLAEAATVIG